MEWVEVKGRTVEVAVIAALEELRLDSEDKADIEIIQEPEKGFMGIGARDAIVRVKPKPAGRKRSGRRSSGRGKSSSSRQGQRKPQRQSRKRSAAPAKEEKKVTASSKNDNSDAEPIDIQEQADIVGGFLEGLLDAYGLKGSVDTSVEDDRVIIATVTGEQTEALVGEKGKILQAIHELCRTVVQRKSRHGARIRLDIAGYAERRREALTIFANRKAEEVLAEGEQVMFEPMNAADRKVIHDTITDVEGVRTFSVGQEPRRSVVLAPVERD